MIKKKLVVETTEGIKEEFDIENFGGKYYVFKRLTNVLGGYQTRKIGDASDIDAAVELVKIFVGKPVNKLSIEEVR